MPPIVLRIRQKVSEWTVPRPRKLGFFTVPIDIRYEIYKLVLIDPVLRWDKRHKLNCVCKTFNPRMSEPPPFLMISVNINERGVTTTTDCDCAKREGMNLLLANRRVHEEAAPIFWSHNTFCCLAGWDVIGATDYALRPETLTWIKHISITNTSLSLDPSGHVKYFGATGLKRDEDWHESLFWVSISKLSSLSSLQVPPYLLFGWEFHESHMAAWLSNPKLKIEMLGLIPFCRDPDVDVIGYAGLDTEESCMHWSTIYVQTTRSLDITPSRDSCFDYCCHSWYVTFFDILFDLETIVKTRFFGADPSHLVNWQDFWRIPEGFDEFNNQQDIYIAVEGFPEDVEIPIKLYGLPSSKQTEARRAQEKAARDADQRAINGLTVEQNKVHEASRDHKRFWRRCLQKLDMGRWNRYCYVDNPWIKDSMWDPRGNPSPQPLPNRIEATERKAKEKAKRKSEKSNAEARKIERKRVHGKRH
ncbi:hypothetical protein CGCTS75_v014747 [Colletotrichum tropicale]|nr:hypothetical protein CGCTS75_v014747 [Colletotrichum tropicale]